MTDLKLFIQPDLLQRIGARRLGILLRPFAPELQAINFPIPPPDEPGQNDYFHTLAAAIARTDAVPDSVLKVLLTLETAASPRNNLTLEAAIKRRLPNVSLPPDFVLDRALEVWIVASLCALPNRPWSAVTRDNGSPKPISEAWLSRQLRPFGVRSRTLRINGVKAKGYELADFVEAFANHLDAK
jgi:hypothetical protein